MFKANQPIVLTEFEEKELSRRTRSQRLRVEDVQRARLILMLAAGESYQGIADRLSCSPTWISRWRQRFLQARLAGLYSKHQGRKVEKRTPAMQAKILNTARQTPPDGSTHWSTRKLATHVGASHMMVARVLRSAHLRPHRLKSYMTSDDPNFETKAADVIGLYMNPPQHAAVFCVDEKTAIQALDRLDPVLPMSPGRAEPHGFEYYRHRALSLYAALNTQTGEVHGRTAERHTSEEFVAFLGQIVPGQPRNREIHIIADNLSAHKTERVRQFLAVHKRVHIHYTPTYSSWLNQVEIWFAKIERDVIARGIFTSKQDLRRKLMRYIKAHNKDPKPYKWSWNDISRRISPATTSTVTVH